MSFREKMHYLSFIGLIIGFGWYFWTFPWDQAGTKVGMMASGWMLIPATILFIIIMIVGSVYFAIRTPKEANLAEDERETNFHMKGAFVAYYPLVLGGWLNIGALFLGVSHGWAVALLVATLVFAELIRIGVQLYFYRRGY